MRKGSYTIEAAILVPLLILVMARAVISAAELYKEIERQEAVADFWAVDRFYMVQGVKEVLND